MDGTTTVANPYHYADNDPLNKTDPLGLRPSDDGAFLPPLTFVVGGMPISISQVGDGPTGGTAFDQMMDRLERIDDIVQEEAPSWAREDLFVTLAGQSLAGLEARPVIGWWIPGGAFGAGNWDDKVFPDDPNAGEIEGTDGWNPQFIDEDLSPARHFIGWFAVGYHTSSSWAKASLRWFEWTEGDPAGTQQDIRSGEAAIKIAFLLQIDGFTIENAMTAIRSVAGGSHPGGTREREPPGSPGCIISPWC